MKILLASSSIYRKQQLESLGLDFISQKPDFNEDSHKSKDTSPQDLCRSLAFRKAKSLQKKFPDHIIIGSDQIAEINGEILGKPKTFEKALIQLNKLNNKTHNLLTAICVLYKDKVFEHTDLTQLSLRNHSQENLKNYIQTEDVLNCAGSYKIESRGLFLFSKIETKDYTSIIGLPLMKLVDILHSLDFSWIK